VTSKSDRSFYQLKLETLDGKPISLTDYQDYTLLVVNTASRCGFTPQLTQLNELKQKYKNKKFEIFAFPSNDFRQEHTESKAIAARASEFGEPQYVMMAPTKVTGPNTSPLFQMLKQQSSLVPQEIQWNFEKFIIAPGGKVVGHFRSRIAPTDPQIIAIINLHLD
jgi:glutathione peroxidase